MIIVREKWQIVMLFLVIFVVILSLFTAIAISNNRVKNLEAENATMRKALDNPAVVVKPKMTIQYITRTIEKEVPVERIETIILDGGSTTFPILPSAPAPREKVWQICLDRNFNDGTFEVRLDRNIWKALSANIQAGTSGEISAGIGWRF